MLGLRIEDFGGGDPGFSGCLSMWSGLSWASSPIGELSGGVGVRVGVGPLKSCCISSAEEGGCSELVCDLVLQGLCMHERNRRLNLSFQSDNTVKSEKGIGGGFNH